jgi:hypothetical protein
MIVSGMSGFLNIPGASCGKRPFKIIGIGMINPWHQRLESHHCYNTRLHLVQRAGQM